MNSFRNNGIKFNQQRLSDDEVLGILDHSNERVRTAQLEAAHMLGIATSRGLIEVDPIEEPPLEVA